MNTTQQTARVGLFFLLGVALVWVTFETLSDGKLFEERSHTLIAGFDDLKQLKSGDDVRMAGVKIGSVPIDPAGGPPRRGRPATSTRRFRSRATPSATHRHGRADRRQLHLDRHGHARLAPARRRRRDQDARDTPT